LLFGIEHLPSGADSQRLPFPDESIPALFLVCVQKALRIRVVNLIEFRRPVGALCIRFSRLLSCTALIATGHNEDKGDQGE
jgi:hypothetical protein